MSLISATIIGLVLTCWGENIMCNVKIWKCYTTCAPVGRCGLVHALHIRVCVRVCISACAWRPLSSLAHLPRQKTPVSPAISPSDSWKLDSGTRGERKEGGREEERKRRHRAWIWGRWKEMREEKRRRHTEGVAIARSSLPPPPLWGPGVLLPRGHDWRGEKKKACPRVSLGISAPASAGLGDGEGAETRRQIRLVSRGSSLCCYTTLQQTSMPPPTPSLSAWHISLKWMPGFESATQAFLCPQTKLFPFFPAGQVFSVLLLLLLFLAVFVTAGNEAGVLCCFFFFCGLYLPTLVHFLLVLCYYA